MTDKVLSAGFLLQGGKYRILGFLGQGGFGITYEAEQVSLGRKVAIKEFFMKGSCERQASTASISVPTVDNRLLVARFKEKFIREARMIASMENSHIVKIYDVFEENNTAYYVMESIQGGSLSQIVKNEGPFPQDVAVDYIKQVGEALNYVHMRKVLHLDVKPSNILLRKEGHFPSSSSSVIQKQDGQAVLIDFGVSKHYDEAGQQTSSTPVGISVGYAPIEQYQAGDIANFTPASDIYSLGATLYYLVSGTVPTSAPDILISGLKRPEGVSDTVWNAILAAMQPRLTDRPQSIPEFLSLLSEGAAPWVPGGQNPSLLNEGTVVNNATPKPAEAKSESSKNPKGHRKSKITMWMAFMAAAIIAAVVGFFKIGSSPEQSKDHADTDTSAVILSDVPVPAPSSTSLSDESEIKLFSVSVITSPSGARVYLNGSDQHKSTPAELKDLKAGTYQISVKKDGYEENVVPVTLSNNSPNPFKLSITLVKEQNEPEREKEGSLKIESTPSGASIFLDNKAIGKRTPAVVDNLSEGSHNIRLNLEGYNSETRSVRITAGKQSKLNLTLTKEPEKTGSLKVESAPSGASIIVNGKDIGQKTPYTVENLSVGQYNVKLVLDGYYDVTGVVEIAPGVRSDFSKKLNVKTPPSNYDMDNSNAQNQIEAEQGSANGHDWVDLGLSVKWATTNIGASKPGNYGDYIAWGETKAKQEYSWFFLKYCKDEDGLAFSKYNTSSKFGSVDNLVQLESGDDAAKSVWGGRWRIPTDAEWTELRTKCKWTWTSQNGHHGFTVTGRNGKSIFIPAAGCRYGTSSNGVGKYGYYWSSSLNKENPGNAWLIVFNKSGATRNNDYRYYGLSIRPVMK